jgi:hypothetical protein
MNPEPAGHDELERGALQLLLAGNHPILEALRQQLAKSSVLSREFTGAGFFTNFGPSPDAPRAPSPCDRFQIGGVYAEIPGLRHGAGFILFVTNGYIDFLEGFCYDEDWPAQVSRANIYYAGHRASDPAAIDA